MTARVYADLGLLSQALMDYHEAVIVYHSACMDALLGVGDMSDVTLQAIVADAHAVMDRMVEKVRDRAEIQAAARGNGRGQWGGLRDEDWSLYMQELHDWRSSQQ